jgi:hypothetical protein
MSTKKILTSILESPERSQEMVKTLVAHRENADWTASHRADLIEKFADSYVAVRNKEVVMHDKNILRLIRRLKAKFGEISDITIEHVTDKPIKLLF